MNDDIFAGQWRQMRGQLKQWWGKLADEDFDRIAGQKDKLIGSVQEKYGYTRDMAEQEIEKHFKEYGDKMTSPGRDPNLTNVISGAVDKANEATKAIGKKIESLGSVVRETAPNEGNLGTMSKTVADGFESAGTYLQENKLNRLAKDFGNLIRTYPVQSALIAIGIGFFVVRRDR